MASGEYPASNALAASPKSRALGVVMAKARNPLQPRLIGPMDVLHQMAITEENIRNCMSVDFIRERIDARRSSVGLHADVRDKKRRVEPTLHDKAVDNPILRDILRRMQ